MVDGMRRLLVLAALVGAVGCAQDDIYLDPEGEVSIDPAFSAADQQAIISGAEDLWSRDTSGRVALRFTIGGPGMPIYVWGGDGEHAGKSTIGDEPPKLGLVAGVHPWTVAHELGHLMGLREHSPTPNSLMSTEFAETTEAIDAETLDRFCARWGCP
jgi:hypothetical protein